MALLSHPDKAADAGLRRERLIERAVAAISLISTICFGLLTWMNTRDSERSQATTEYFKILQYKDSPAYLQAAALTMLAERGLISYDMAFLGAYQLEQRYSEAILTPLVFAFVKSKESISRPIGYVDFSVATTDPTCEAGKAFCLSGWAFDTDTDMTKMEGDVWIDNLLQSNAITFEAEPRTDIIHLFGKKRNDAKEWKYGIRVMLLRDHIPVGRDVALRVRLKNSGFEFTDIFNARIRRLDDGRLTLGAPKTDAGGAPKQP
jgi:hypothetical protein